MPKYQKVVRPFFGYYGGKWRDTPRLYPRPEHDVIVEPFAGSAGYSLRHGTRPDSDTGKLRKVFLCEADPVLVGVWHYLINEATPEDIRAIPDIPDGGTVDDLDVPIPVKHLVGFWLNRGTSRPRKSPSAWMKKGDRPGSFWGSRVRETIASQLKYIKHWEISNGGYETCPTPDTATWFIDPPYVEAGKHYHHGSDDIDFEHLRDWCMSRVGQVIVCEADDADWLPFRELADTKTTRRGKRSKELVWLNSFDDDDDADQGDPCEESR